MDLEEEGKITIKRPTRCPNGHKLETIGHSGCDDICKCECGTWFVCGLGSIWPYKLKPFAHEMKKTFNEPILMNLQKAREIGKIRNAIPKEPIKEAKVELLSKLDQLEKQEREEERNNPQKVEVINKTEVQKIEGKTETNVTNWPAIVKVFGEIVAKVAFPAIQKITGAVTAKIENFPAVQKIFGKVNANIDNFPEVQRVEVTNPTNKMYVVGKTEVSNLPLGKADKEGDPERFVAIRLTDGKHYYDLTELVIAGGGGSGVQYQDPDQRWIREDFTYDANNNVTRTVAYDGKGNKKTTDYEYDENENVTRKTSKIESA